MQLSAQSYSFSIAKYHLFNMQNVNYSAFLLKNMIRFCMIK